MSTLIEDLPLLWNVPAGQQKPKRKDRRLLNLSKLNLDSHRKEQIVPSRQLPTFETFRESHPELVACRSEFVTTDAAGGVGVFPLDRSSVVGVGIDVAAEFVRQVGN